MSTTRDQVYNMTQNPLAYAQHAAELGFSLKDLIFYRFHAVPPLLFPQDRQLEHVPLEHEKRLSRHWLGHFLASAFMGILTKTS